MRLCEKYPQSLSAMKCGFTKTVKGFLKSVVIRSHLRTKKFAALREQQLQETSLIPPPFQPITQKVVFIKNNYPHSALI
ncbi:hypothetical protein DMA11_00115 [Marinilabiliaceae bacterium JC017]|nr:hypothetical protein DMA11_00115 [Marinilabiliaceae bacterium JC017]